MTDSETSGDIVDAILQDHQLIRDLFADVEGAEAGAQRADRWQALVRTLAVHETAEEEILHPTVRTLGDEANALVDARLAEERAAKDRLAELERLDPDQDDFLPQLAQFRTLVLHHAEQEEQHVLPRLRAGADPRLLAGLATAFHAAKAVAPTHAHKFAPESAIGNLVMGPAVALVDRVRDAARDAMKLLRRG